MIEVRSRSENGHHFNGIADRTTGPNKNTTSDMPQVGFTRYVDSFSSGERTEDRECVERNVGRCPAATVPSLPIFGHNLHRAF